MLKTRIIPCLDVADGRVVKGVNFVSLVDAGDPVECAQTYDAQGADELCFLDIAATRHNRQTMYDVVRSTAEQCFMPVTAGGGVRSPDDMQALLRAGADKVSINSAAVKNPEIISDCANRFGRQCVVIAIDAKSTSDGNYVISTHGGSRMTAIDAVEFAKEAEARGAGELLLTSMDRDGTRNGFDLELTKKIVEAVKLPVIASGGVGTLQHLVEGVTLGGASAVLAASIFHFGDHSIREAKEYMARHGIPIRI